MRCAQKTNRPGAMAVELLLTLPILMALVLGMIQLSLLISARQQVTAAAREGGRAAALGGSPEEIKQTVDRYFGCKIAQVQAAIADDSGVPIQSGESVTVVVRVKASCMVPELLGFAGFGMKNQELVARAVMRKE